MAFLKELRKPNYILRRYSEHEPNAPVLRLSGVGLRYENSVALEGVNLDLHSGERMAVVGPNGAGKSTLFQIIAAVLSATEGTVEVFGHEAGNHRCVAYLPQRSQVDWNFPVSVADAVMMGRIGKLGLFRQPGAEDWKQVYRALEVVKLENFAKRQIGQLSWGQQQRMFVARALAQEAELMLMDEPLTGLDVNSQDDLFDILDHLRQENVTIMVALHDLKLAAERFDRVMLLNHVVVGLGKPDDVFQTDNLMRAYSGHLRIMPVGDGTVALGDTCCDEGEHIHA
jgi:manganese/iron transport system ATP-binding protein